jgi:hypothetical protein
VSFGHKPGGFPYRLGQYPLDKTPNSFGIAAILEDVDAAAGVGTDSVFGIAAVLEGADVASDAGTDSVSGVAAVLEDPEVVVASGTGTLVVQSAEVPAGRKQVRSIYRITVDGQVFHFRTMAGALAFLDKAKELAQAVALAQTRAATVAKLVPPKITAPRELRAAVIETKREIAAIYKSAAIDIEIAMLMALSQRRDDENDLSILLMLLM